MDNQIIEECNEYSKIESHLQFSKTLFLLKEKGVNIMEQFNMKKFDKKTQRGTCAFVEDTAIIYNNLANVVDKKKNSLKLCFCLSYYLDELMFGEIMKLDTFIIEDLQYDLTKVYYSPSEWILDQEQQTYLFYNEKEININEAMYLICYLKDFENFLLEIENYLKTFLDTYTIKKKIVGIINKLRLKFKNIWDIVLKTIEKSI
jgi:hypothetical protein